MLELLSMLTSELIFTLIVPGIFVGLGLLIFGNFLPSAFVQYKIPMIVTGIFLVLFFTYESGRYSEYSANKLKDAATKIELAELRAKAGEITVETIIEYKDRIKYVEKIKEVPIDVYIPKEANSACVINDVTGANIRMLINTSNQGIPAAAPIRVDGTTK